MKKTVLAVTELTDEQLKYSTFYVIETFPHPWFVTDENGETKTFETYEQALTEAEDCQQGYVVIF